MFCKAVRVPDYPTRYPITRPDTRNFYYPNARPDHFRTRKIRVGSQNGFFWAKNYFSRECKEVLATLSPDPNLTEYILCNSVLSKKKNLNGIYHAFPNLKFYVVNFGGKFEITRPDTRPVTRFFSLPDPLPDPIEISLPAQP